MGFPGLGYVGKISVSYLAKQLKTCKIAELYSPFFPYHVIVNSYGAIRLPKAKFYYWKNNNIKASDIILLTGDSQAQTLEGQYELVKKILDYAERRGVKKIITIGGHSVGTEESNHGVICASTNSLLLNDFLKLGAKISPPGNPIAGVAGLVLGLAGLRKIDAICLLGETFGYMPDPLAAKEVLKILKKFLKININLNSLNEEIKRSDKIIEKMKDFQKTIEPFTEKVVEEKRATYIS